MARWWCAVPQDGAIWWDALVESAKEEAARAGAVLRSERPVFGWIAENARDRKLYPCKDSARGAMPAWIWYGDIR